MSELPSGPECQSVLTYANGDHDIDCKIDGIGAMELNSQFVKKA